MTFNDIVIKNFKSNIRKYTSYFLCCCLCIVVLFMFISILNNNNFKKALLSNNVSILLKVSIAILSLFTVFFISYALSAFLKQRSKEFGVLLLLGMSKKDLLRLIIIEIMLIISAAIVSGLIIGSFFSYALFNLLLKVLDLNTIAFSLNIISYIEAVGLFLIVLCLEILFAAIYSRKLEVFQILRQDRRPEYNKKQSYMFGIILFFIGFLLIYLSFEGLSKYIKEYKNISPSNSQVQVCLILIFIGSYLVLAQMFTVILGTLKKYKNIYYKNLLVITEISYKFNQNKKIIFISTILGVLIIFFIGTVYSYVLDVSNTSKKNQPFHIVFREYSNNISISEDILNKIIEGSNTKLIQKTKLDFLECIRDNNFDNIGELTRVSVISSKQYNNISGKALKIDKGKVVQLNMDVDAPASNSFPYNIITLKFKDKSFNLKFSGEERNLLINLKVQPSLFMLIINDDDFNMIKSEIKPEFIGSFHLLNFDDWKKTLPIAKEIQKVLTTNENLSNYQENVKLNKNGIAGFSSRIEFYQSLKQEISMVLFVVSFMGILFFVCSSSVLYFKILTDIENKRKKYISLRKIGVTNREFKKVINMEVKVIFFIPVILSSIIGYKLVDISVSNSIYDESFERNIYTVMLIYFGLQLIYYIGTKKKYLKYIIK